LAYEFAGAGLKGYMSVCQHKINFVSLVFKERKKQTENTPAPEKMIDLLNFFKPILNTIEGEII